jgi:hypothetical protein
VAKAGQFLDDLGTLGGEELAAYFEEPCRAAESLCQCKGRPCAANVQGDDQL